jgi:succinate dehydrogenase hydrophobic anchor subunit
MKNELRKTVLVNIPLLLMMLLISFFFSSRGHNELMGFLGIGFLIVAIINLIIGVIVLLVGIIGANAITRNYAASMLVVASISLLCGLTFCSVLLTHH